MEEGKAMSDLEKEWAELNAEISQIEKEYGARLHPLRAKQRELDAALGTERAIKSGCPPGTIHQEANRKLVLVYFKTYFSSRKGFKAFGRRLKADGTLGSQLFEIYRDLNPVGKYEGVEAAVKDCQMTDQRTELRRSIAFCEEEIRREPLVMESGSEFQKMIDEHCQWFQCCFCAVDLAFANRVPFAEIEAALEAHRCGSVLAQ